MIDYNYKVRNGQNKSWEDKSSPRQRTRIFLRKTRRISYEDEKVFSYVSDAGGGICYDWLR